MAAITLSLTPYSSTNAQFQAWGSGVDGTFITCGWVRTSDTGQINWASVAFPASANTSQGYSIFKMNDSWQSTAPVFLKIEYGSGTGAALTPGFWITIGTGSDGSGNITGVLLTRLQVYPWNNVNTASNCYFSGNTDRYCACLWPNSANSYEYILFSIERTKDSSGNTTSTGLLFLTNGQTSSSGTKSQYIPFSGTIPSLYSAWNCNVPTVTNPSTGGSFKNTAALYTVKCWTPGESGPSSNIFLYQITDFTPGNTVLLSLFDASITGTYLPIVFNTVSFSPSTNRGLTSVNVSLAMRYE